MGVELGKNMEKEVSVTELEKRKKPQSTSFSFEIEGGRQQLAQGHRGRERQKGPLSGFRFKLFYDGLLGLGLYFKPFPFIASETFKRSFKWSKPYLVLKWE